MTETCKKLMLLLTQSADQRPGILEPYLASEGQRIKERLPKGASHRRAFRLADDPTRQIAHASEMADAPPAFDAVFEVGAADVPYGQLIKAVSGIGERLGRFLDPARSAVIAGVEHTIISGDHSLMLVFALRRLDALTSEAFHDYWLNHHARLALTVPGLQGYRQFHGDVDVTAQAAAAAGIGICDFEGAAEGYYRNLPDFLRLMSQPEVVKDALEDEKRFIDHSRSSIGLYHVAWKTSA